MKMNVKELVKHAVRAFPCKYQMYRIARLAVRQAKPLHIDNARERLMRIHPKPAYRYKRSEFAYAQTDRDLSIIVPAYNVDRFVGPCLESVLSQKTQVDFEVIVVNDGSTDGTADVIAEYAQKDDRIRVISQSNKGLSGARNTGIDQARGKALMFVDSDDMIAPTHVDALMAALRAGDCDYVTSDYTDIDEAGNQIGQGKPRKFMGTAWGRAYWRYVWEDVRFPEGYLYEDTILQYLIETRFSGLQVSDNGYWYRHRDFSISHVGSGNIRSIDTYWILEEMIQEAETMNIPLRDVYELTVRQCCASVFGRRQQFDKQWIPVIFAACADFLDQLQNGNDDLVLTSDLSKDMEESLKTRNYRLWNLAGYFEIVNTL